MRARQLKLGLKDENEEKERKKLRRESTWWLIGTVLSFIGFAGSGYLLKMYRDYYIDHKLSMSFYVGVLALSGVILITSVAMWGQEKKKCPLRFKLK